MKLIGLISFLAMLPFYSAGTAMAAGTSVPYCSSTDGETEVKYFKSILPIPEYLVATVEVWNGCFKVTHVNAEGHYMTEFYDPTTKKRVF